MSDWLKQMFIDEAKPALDRHSGVGGGGESLPNTIILEDESGNQIAAILTDEEVQLTADKDTDIRDGTTAVTSEGLVTGTKDIPAYHVSEGTKLIPNGNEFFVSFPNYNYTKFQALMCMFNTNLSNSVHTDRVIINGNVYPVESTEIESNVSIDAESESVKFGMINDTGKPYVIRYFSYKEIY